MTKNVPKLFQTIGRRENIIMTLQRRSLSLRTLNEELSDSKPTLSRALRNLEKLGIVEYIDGKWTTTNYGRLLCQGYKKSIDEFETLAEIKPLIRSLPCREEQLYCVIESAQAYLSNRSSPHRPFKIMRQNTKPSNQVLSYIPLYINQYIKTIECLHTNVLDSFELYFDEKAATGIVKMNDMATIEKSFDWTEISSESTCSVFLIDQTSLWIGVHDEMGAFQGFLHMTENESVSWGQEFFKSLDDQGNKNKTKGLVD